MRLFYGTQNESKLRNLRAILAGLPVEFATPQQLGIALPAVEETGATPLQNARLKAWAYYRATGLPSFALDSGLYLQGMDAAQQPGPYVRRVGGVTLSDEGFIAHYAALAHQNGGHLRACFVNGLCAVADESHSKEAFGPQVSTDWFWIVEKPCDIRLPGFPMDSIAVDPHTGRYWVQRDLEDERSAKGAALAAGVRRFFVELLQGDLHAELRRL